MVIMESVCDLTPDHTFTWNSQPMEYNMPLGNLISAAILFSGSSPVKAVNVLKFSRIETFCLRTYYNIQGSFLLPAISSVWEQEQQSILEAVDGTLKLGGDARCCSPGLTAKYGSYTVMDLETSKVIDVQLLQSSEVANSNAMELEGLRRSIAHLQEQGIEVSDFTTDRHPQVKKYMREKHPTVNHWFDVWHVAKGVKKKVEAASKRKNCDVLSRWSQSISNHLYFCASASNGNGEMLVDMWKSLLNHVANIHEGHCSLFPKCQHGPLEEDREWIKKGVFNLPCSAHTLKNKKNDFQTPQRAGVIEKQYLLKDIKKLSLAEQTYGIESFHKICCYFATKFVHFFYLSMDGRLKLACLHFNENSNRSQNVTKAGEPMWQISRPKYKKGAPVALTYNYVDRWLDEVMLRRREFKSYRQCKADLEPVIQSTPKPVAAKYDSVDKQAVLSAHKCLFGNQSMD